MRIAVAEPDISEREIAYVTDAVRRGEVSSTGPYVERFERAFAEFCEVPHAISCMNGTVALHLALIGLGIGPGDEVIVPALTYVAAANAVLHAGATVVLADVHPDHWGLDPEAVAARITPRTKAIIAVHLYGHPADMDPLNEIAARHGIAVIEDAAEAQGARYRGRRVGGIGNVGTFSFFGNKIMTTGEGGMVTTSDARVAERVRLFKNQGNDPTRRYWHIVVGYNYRLTNLQAALGLAQVERAEELLKAKREIAAAYRAGLSGIPGTMQPQMPWAESVHWMNCLMLDAKSRVDARQLQDELAKRHIETRPFFQPVSKLPMYPGNGTFPVSERLSKNGLNLPSGPRLALDKVEAVIAAIRETLC
jgi:perosamine synthetase